MDKLTIEQLKVDTTIGAYKWEQHVTQSLLLDISLTFDNRLVAKNDDLNDAIDYASLSEHLVAWFTTQHFQLIETAAEKTAALILATAPCTSVVITISKPQALQHARNVAVTISRP